MGFEALENPPGTLGQVLGSGNDKEGIFPLDVTPKINRISLTSHTQRCLYGLCDGSS
jgi:hypothetical protein